MRRVYLSLGVGLGILCGSVPSAYAQRGNGGHGGQGGGSFMPGRMPAPVYQPPRSTSPYRGNPPVSPPQPVPVAPRNNPPQRGNGVHTGRSNSVPSTPPPINPGRGPAAKNVNTQKATPSNRRPNVQTGGRVTTRDYVNKSSRTGGQATTRDNVNKSSRTGGQATTRDHVNKSSRLSATARKPLSPAATSRANIAASKVSTRIGRPGVKGVLATANQVKMQKTFDRLRGRIRNPLLLAALLSMANGRRLSGPQCGCLGEYINSPGCAMTSGELACAQHCLDVRPAPDEITPDNNEVAPDNNEVAPDNNEVAPDNNEVAPDNNENKENGGNDNSAEQEEGGVLIQKVNEDSPAGQAGLRAGDVILNFGSVRVRTFDELRDAVRQVGGQVKVVFINGENNAVEYLIVEPLEGRIGVTCE